MREQCWFGGDWRYGEHHACGVGHQGRCLLCQYVCGCMQILVHGLGWDAHPDEPLLSAWVRARAEGQF